MRLWVFGDSFSDLKQGESLSQVDNWITLLSRHLSTDEIFVRAKYGVSNEWIYNELVNCSANIVKDDYIVVQLTDPSRHWFIEDPTLSNIVTLANLKPYDIERLTVTENHQQAARQYISYLQNQQTDDILHHQLFHAVAYLSNFCGYSNLRMIPGFAPLPAVTGTLVKICGDEFVNEKEKEKWYQTYPVDPRTNHLTKENHQILADKLRDFFLNPGSTLDLTTGFKKHFLKAE